MSDNIDTSLRDAALKLARGGWPVFPIVPNAKRPLCPHGHKEATTDPGQVEAWWTETPNANIGIVPGAVGYASWIWTCGWTHQLGHVVPGARGRHAGHLHGPNAPRRHTSVLPPASFAIGWQAGPQHRHARRRQLCPGPAFPDRWEGISGGGRRHCPLAQVDCPKARGGPGQGGHHGSRIHRRRGSQHQARPGFPEPPGTPCGRSDVE